MHAGHKLAIEFEAGTTTIKVPKALAWEWIKSEMVDFDAKEDTGQVEAEH
jgi:hypothetical protein